MDVDNPKDQGSASKDSRKNATIHASNVNINGHYFDKAQIAFLVFSYMYFFIYCSWVEIQTTEENKDLYIL